MNYIRETVGKLAEKKISCCLEETTSSLKESSSSDDFLVNVMLIATIVLYLMYGMTQKSNRELCD